MTIQNTQTTDNEETIKYSDALLTLVNAAEVKGFDYKIEVYNRKTYFSFRIDKKKNSMIWFNFCGFGTTDQVIKMRFDSRYNGCNGTSIKSFNQELKAVELLGI